MGEPWRSCQPPGFLERRWEHPLLFPPGCRLRGGRLAGGGPVPPRWPSPGCSGACALGGRRCLGGRVVPRTRSQPPAGRSRSTFQPDILCLVVPRVWAGDVGGLPLPGLECSSPCRVIASIAHWTSILPFPLGAGTPLAFCWWLAQGHLLPYFVSRNSH